MQDDDVDDVDDLGKYCLVGQTPGEPKFSFRLWGNLLHHVSNIPRHGGHLMIPILVENNISKNLLEGKLDWSWNVNFRCHRRRPHHQQAGQQSSLPSSIDHRWDQQFKSPKSSSIRSRSLRNESGDQQQHHQHQQSAPSALVRNKSMGF